MVRALRDRFFKATYTLLPRVRIRRFLVASRFGLEFAREGIGVEPG